MNNRKTQRSAILKLLIAARGQDVPLPKIADCAKQYNARLFELLRLGFRIINRTQTINGVKHSWFRLETGPLAKAVSSPETVIAATSIESRGAQLNGLLSGRETV
jgi:hypothetical protein